MKTHPIKLYGKVETPSTLYLLECELFGRRFSLEVVSYDRIISCEFDDFCEKSQTNLCGAEVCKECPKAIGLVLGMNSLATAELPYPWTSLQEAQKSIIKYYSTIILHNDFEKSEVHALFNTPWTITRPTEWDEHE